MIKASSFSLNCGLFKDLTSRFEIPTTHEKQKLFFLSGDPTYYGHADLKMNQVGYDIIQNSIKHSDSAKYPDPEGHLEARTSVAKHFSGENNQLLPDDVILTHGADMGLYLLLLSILNPGDNVLVPEPGYPFYHLQANALGVDVRPYQLQANQSFQIDLESLNHIVDERTKFLWIVNPSNPCGSIFSKTHMEDIIQFCKQKKIFIVSDEVYWNESFSTSQFISFGHMATEDVPVIIAGGLEKTFLVPGWSVSWLLFFDHAKRLDLIKRACVQLCDYLEGPSSFMQLALPQLLDSLTPNYTKNFMGLFEENYFALFKGFEEIKGLVPIPAQGTFYIAVKIELDHFPEFQDDISFLQALLTEENVWILNLSAFNGKVQGFRMMTCATNEIYKDLMPRIIQFCERHRQKESNPQ